MTRQQETGMAIIGAAVMIIFVILLTMCSCATKKVVEERVYVHDTVTVHKSDTVVDVVYKTHTDTVTNTEVHTYTLNNVGDTVKEIHHYHNTEKVIVVDSTDRYRATVDSLRAVLKAQENKKEVKTTNRPRWWEYIVFVLFLSFWVGGVAWAVKAWKKD